MLNDLNIKLISSHLHLCIICKLQTSCEILKQQHIARRRVLYEYFLILLKKHRNGNEKVQTCIIILLAVKDIKIHILWNIQNNLIFQFRYSLFSVLCISESFKQYNCITSGRI